MNKLKYFIKPKYQYFLLLLMPLPFVFIGSVAMINLMINQKSKMAIHLLIVILVASFILLIFIPNILQISRNKFLVEFIYTYAISIGIYAIRYQNKVLSNR